MYDVVGGGFARYSVDDQWLTPHFEKMLYDNALLARAYLHAWLLTGDKVFRDVCESSLDFVIRELTHPLGGFYSSLDADSEGEEGKYYTWSLDDINLALGSEDANLASAVYQITAQGNFDGKNILQRALSDEQINQGFGIPLDEIDRHLIRLKNALLTLRGQRRRPFTDDKILVFWNSLMTITMAEAGCYFGRQDYLDAAEKNASFLLNNLEVDNRLMRSWRQTEALGADNDSKRGVSHHKAYLEDYASLCLALLTLYETTANLSWYQNSLRLAHAMLRLFSDSSGHFYDTGSDHESLLYRPHDLQDNATPSGSALAATVLLKLAAFGESGEWRDIAEGMLAAVAALAVQYPTAFAQWLQAADFALGPVMEVAMVGNKFSGELVPFLDIYWANFRPRSVLSVNENPPPPGSPKLVLGKEQIDYRATVFVCQGMICKKPVTTIEEFLTQLTA